MNRTTVERKGRVFIKTGISRDRAENIIEVDNYRYDNKKDIFSKMDEPKIIVRNFSNVNPAFIGTHQELVYKLTDSSEKLLQTLVVIAYDLGANAYYTEDSMADIQTAIQLAKEFEEQHRDTDWTEEDWLLAVTDYSKLQIQKLMTEE